MKKDVDAVDKRNKILHLRDEAKFITMMGPLQINISTKKLKCPMSFQWKKMSNAFRLKKSDCPMDIYLHK